MSLLLPAITLTPLQVGLLTLGTAVATALLGFLAGLWAGGKALRDYEEQQIQCFPQRLTADHRHWTDTFI